MSSFLVILPILQSKIANINRSTLPCLNWWQGDTLRLIRSISAAKCSTTRKHFDDPFWAQLMFYLHMYVLVCGGATCGMCLGARCVSSLGTTKCKITREAAATATAQQQFVSANCKKLLVLSEW